MPYVENLQTTMGNTPGKWKFFGETLMSAVLETYYPRLVLHDMGSHITLPGQSGKTVWVSQWQRVKPVSELTISNTTDEAAESESPVSQRMLMQNYTGTMQAFGGSFGYTDAHANMTAVTSELVEGARQLGASYGETITDNTLAIVYLALQSTDANQIATLMGADGAAYEAALSTSLLTLTDLSKVRASFESTYDSFVPAFPDGNYHGIIHPNVRHDLFVDAAAESYSLTQWLQTSTGQGMYKGTKVPVIHDIKLNISAFDTTDPYNSHDPFDGTVDYTNVMHDTKGTGAAAFFGYMSMFFAPGAFANLSLANGTPSLIIQPFGSAGTQDSLKREMTVGIKGFQTCIPQDMAKRAIFMTTGATLAVDPGNSGVAS